MNTELKYTLLGVVATIIWSFAPLLLTEVTSIPAFEILSFQFSLAFLMTLLRYLFSGQKKEFFSFSVGDLIAAAAALLTSQACFIASFRYSEAAVVNLVHYLWPTLLILFSSWLPQEEFCFAYFFSCFMCLWGVYYLLPMDQGFEISYGTAMGLTLAFSSALFWALYNLYTRYRKSSSANCISCASGIAAVFSFLLHRRYESFVIPNLAEQVIIVILGIIQMGLAFYFWECALKRGRVKVLGLASYGTPILSTLILVLFGKSDFEYRLIISMFAISFSPIFPFFKTIIKSSRGGVT